MPNRRGIDELVELVKVQGVLGSLEPHQDRRLFSPDPYRDGPRVELHRVLAHAFYLLIRILPKERPRILRGTKPLDLDSVDSEPFRA